MTITLALASRERKICSMKSISWTLRYENWSKIATKPLLLSWQRRSQLWSRQPVAERISWRKATTEFDPVRRKSTPFCSSSMLSRFTRSRLSKQPGMLITRQKRWSQSWFAAAYTTLKSAWSRRRSNLLASQCWRTSTQGQLKAMGIGVTSSIKSTMRSTCPNRKPSTSSASSKKSKTRCKRNTRAEKASLGWRTSSWICRSNSASSPSRSLRRKIQTRRHESLTGCAKTASTSQ